MITQKLCIMPSNTIMAAENTMNEYLSSLPAHPQFLNYRANIGISAINSQLLMHIIASIGNTIIEELSMMSGCDTSNDAQNKALAGVGSPMNDVVCRVLRLNLANRRAENAAITNAKNGTYGAIGSINDGYSITESWVNTIAAGATPKVTSSASESSSLPMGELTPSRRALIPSKKSNTAPATIHMSASCASPHKAK